MTTYNSWAEAAQASIDERWGPICEAKTCDEMKGIYNHSRCAMCIHKRDRAKVGGLPLGCHVIPCPLDDTHHAECCEDWYKFNLSVVCDHRRKNFNKALAAARRIKARLEEITRGDK